MTLYEFLMLEDDKQYQTVWDRGIFLDAITINNQKIVLYAIDKFFVEIYYDVVSNKIVDKKTFKYGDSLDKYLNIKTS